MRKQRIQRFRIGLAALMFSTITAVTPALTAVPADAQQAAAVPSPYNDSFYTQPDPMPTVPPGTVLNSLSVTVTALGIPVKVTAWQILYASTGMTGEPVADVATVLLPDQDSATSPRPLLSYQVAEDADTMNCAFVKDELSDHVSLAVGGAGAALNYLIARFAGGPAPSTCSTGGVTVATTTLQPPNNLVTELTAAAGLTGFI